MPEAKDTGLRQTFCQRCGRNAGEITLLDGQDTLYRCESGEHNHIGLPQNRKCDPCGVRTTFIKIRKIEPSERLPAPDPCAICAEELAEWDAEIKKGGAYFKCMDCGAHGVLLADSDLAKAVRKKLKIRPPEPAAIQINKSVCANCAKEREGGG